MGQRLPICIQVLDEDDGDDLDKHFDDCRDVDESLVMVDARGSPGRVIVPGNVMRDPRVFRFKLSPDQKYVMLAFRPQRYLNLFQTSVHQL